MRDKRQLLCTFSETKHYREIIENIKKFYKISDVRFFVFSNGLNKEEVVITYNIQGGNNQNRFPNTISIHRKKQYNVLYSINAMNQIIKDENGGVFDRDHVVRWEDYKNSLIITGEVSIRVIPLELINIIQ